MAAFLFARHFCCRVEMWPVLTLVEPRPGPTLGYRARNSLALKIAAKGTPFDL